MKERSVKITTKNHFDETAENYNNSYDGKFVRVMYDHIIERVINLNPGSILDLGCGNGNILGQLVLKTNADLYGLDLSPNMISHARKKLGAKADLMVGDAEQLPYNDNQFDVVICNASFHHYTKPVQVLEEVKRTLKPGGTFILGDPTAPFDWYLKILNWGLHWSNSGDYRIYGKQDIFDLLNRHDFEVSQWKKINHRAFVLNATCI